ncbi:WD repeat-containing protein 74-like [Crassostrea virginica]
MAAPMLKVLDVFVGSETGLLKGINVSKAEWLNLQDTESVDKSKEIVCLCWKDGTESEVCMGSKNRTVKTWDAKTRVFSESVTLGTEDSKLRGIRILDGNYVSCVDTGLVRLWKNEEVESEINAGKDVFAFDQNLSESSLFATGGKENELKIWDIELTEKPKFTAKNVKNDWLNLRVPVWVTCARFVPNSEKIYTATGHHQVRLYDTKAQRRPVLDMSFDEYPITALSLCPKDENQVVVGNTIGKLAVLDVRKGRPVQVFKGLAGAVRAVEHHPTLPVIASCGLDRYLHIHSIEDKSHQKIYLKSRLSSLLLRSRWDDGSNDINEEEVVIKSEVLSDDDGDDIWENMEVVQTKTKQKEQKDSENMKKIKRKLKEASDDNNRQRNLRNDGSKKRKHSVKA